jgi:glycosyltransferase involved in cell wall biosynthesis
MALEVPVVSTAVGGVPEIVEDGVSGRLVPPDDPESLAEGLIEVLSNANLHARFSRNGKRRVEDAFSVEARVSGLRRIYEEISGG